MIEFLVQLGHSVKCDSTSTMPLGGGQFGRCFNFQIQRHELSPLLINNITQSYVFQGTIAQATTDAFHNITLTTRLTLVDCHQVLFVHGSVVCKVTYTLCQIIHVNSGHAVFTGTDNWKGSKLWVGRKPSTSEKFIKNIICFAVTVSEARANDMNAEFVVDFTGCKGKILQIFEVLELGGRDTLLKVRVAEFTFTGRSVVPAEDRADNDESLLFGARGLVERLSENFDYSFSLSWVSTRHKINNKSICGEHALGKCLGLCNHVKQSDG